MENGAIDVTRCEDGQPSLRERRRRQTEREIRDAALGLFERNGVTATTVEDIAHAAGISARTFFRHCPSKEHAVLLDDLGMEEDLLAVISSLGPGEPVLPRLERYWGELARSLERDESTDNHALRVRRLMTHEPTLLAAGLRVDAERAQRLTAAVVAHTGMADLTARVVVASFNLLVRITYDEWVCHVESGAPMPFTEIFEQVRAALRDASAARPAPG